MQMAFEHRFTHRIRPDSGNPCNLVSDLSDTQDLEKRLAWYGMEEDTIRKTDESLMKWQRDTLSRAETARDSAVKGLKENWNYVFCEPEPQGSYPAVGLANYRDFTALKGSQIWTDLVNSAGKGHIDAPTTLDRVDRELAWRLVARGYLNTFLLSLFLAPLVVGELDRLTDLKERLDRIVAE
jgi:hypothetical protein